MDNAKAISSLVHTDMYRIPPNSCPYGPSNSGSYFAQDIACHIH